MCEFCRAEEQKERIKKKDPQLFEYIDDHNAIWQAALTLKINTINFMEEMNRYNLHKYYDGNLFEACEMMAHALRQIEANSFKEAREGIKRADR